MNGSKKPPVKKPSLGALTPFKFRESKFKARFSEGKGKFSGYVVDKADNGKRFKKDDPELKRRKAAYKASFISTQKAKAAKAAAQLKKATGLTPAQYYSKLAKNRKK